MTSVLGTKCDVPMPDERLEVSVTFDARHGYIASALELRSPVVRSLTNGLPSRTNVCTRRKRTCGPQGGSPGLMWWMAPAPGIEVP